LAPVGNYVSVISTELKSIHPVGDPPQLGPSLVGKIEIICGDMDNLHLSLAVYNWRRASGTRFGA